MENKAVF